MPSIGNALYTPWGSEKIQDIEEVVRTCENCAAQRSLPPKALLHSWPWENHQIVQ